MGYKWEHCQEGWHSDDCAEGLIEHKNILIDRGRNLNKDRKIQLHRNVFDKKIADDIQRNRRMSLYKLIDKDRVKQLKGKNVKPFLSHRKKKALSIVLNVDKNVRFVRNTHKKKKKLKITKSSSVPPIINSRRLKRNAKLSNNERMIESDEEYLYFDKKLERLYYERSVFRRIEGWKSLPPDAERIPEEKPLIEDTENYERLFGGKAVSESEKEWFFTPHLLTVEEWKETGKEIDCLFKKENETEKS